MIARQLAKAQGAAHIRIDSIEQALRESWPAGRPLDDSGYRVGYAVAEDNLRAGMTVIADSVNPLAVTRDAWMEVARRKRVCAIEIEIVCSDANEHQRRVEGRTSDIPGLRVPNWQEVVAREYEPWSRDHLLIDTSNMHISQTVSIILEAISVKPK